MHISTFSNRISHSGISSLPTLALIALTWNSPVFCGEIHNAAKAGNLAKVEALLKDDPDLVSSKNGLNDTPLHLAAIKGHKKVVELLLDHGADINSNDGSWMPLHLSVSNGHKDVAELLLARGADVNTKDDNGYTPLELAASCGRKGIVEWLLAKGAEVNVMDKYGWTPLHNAAVNGHKDIVKLLLARRAEVNAKNNNGDTPLQLAAGYVHKDVVGLLRRYGGSDTINPAHLIRDAAQSGNFKRVKALIRNNPALISSKDNDGFTPLRWAVANGHKKMVELLLIYGSDVNAKDNDGFTPLHGAKNRVVAEQLLAKGADVNAEVNDTGWTPLHQSADWGNKRLMELLLDNKAEVNARDNQGATPLHRVAINCHKDAAKLLLVKGANVDAKTNGNGSTPLHYAALAGCKGVVILLLANTGQQ
jgi:ankyrin repeat protein